MRAQTIMILVGSGALAWGIGGCGLQKQQRDYTVLQTEDFISDPVTMPTEVASRAETARAPEPVVPAVTIMSPAAATPAGSLPRSISTGIGAGDGMFEAVAIPGSPVFGDELPPPAEPPLVVDAKVGEINGRPVRVGDMLDQAGDRLRTIARTRRLTTDEWGAVRRTAVDPAFAERTVLDRKIYIEFAEGLFKFLLDRRLENELLAEEARFSLKPEQRQGLKSFVQELTDTTRRQAGGSREEAARRLRQRSNLSPEQARKQLESLLLVDLQLNEKIRKRIQVSWKDVQLYYERHPEIYNPPAKVFFRLIRVSTENAEAIARIQAALDSGTPFAEVAATADNIYNRSQGGLADPVPLTGAYQDSDFYPGALGAAARGLIVGSWTKEPVAVGSGTVWLYLEKIEDSSRPLSNRDVQLSIAKQLNDAALEAAKRDYIQRLRDRASYSDIEVMAKELALIVADRFWPAE